jgi:hypothetical protein
MNSPRPKSVTTVSWVLIVIDVTSLVATTANLNDPMTRDLMSLSVIPIRVQYFMMYFGFLAQIVSGFAMLKRQNWGRLLYTIWCSIGLTVGLITSPMKVMMIPGIVFFAVMVFFLFRPKANEYFKGNLPKRELVDA